MISEQEFKEWLDSPTMEPLVIRKEYDSAVYMKAPKGEDFFYLYRQSFYRGEGISQNKNFEYAGFYSKKHGLVYDSCWGLTKEYPTLMSEVGISKMKEIVTEEVRAYVEGQLGNDKNNLEIERLSQDGQRKLDEYKSSWIKRDAESSFLKGKGSQDVRYECPYSLVEWWDDGLLDYITAPEDFIRQQGEKFLKENQDDILLQFKVNELIKAELENLEGIADSPLHRLRNINQALKETEAKTLQITVEKGGQEFSFKYEKIHLNRQDVYGGYWGFHMAKQERDQFERLFGKGTDFSPEDIVDISYRGKSLYSAEPYIPEQEQGLVQSM